jgi:hypothetical protein
MVKLQLQGWGLAGRCLVFTKSHVNTRFENTRHIFRHFLEFSWGLTVISETTGKFQSSLMIVYSLFEFLELSKKCKNPKSP